MSATEEIEVLRTFMINLFHEYVAIDKNKTCERMAAWDTYCNAREKYLEHTAFMLGRKYRRLDQTMIMA